MLMRAARAEYWYCNARLTRESVDVGCRNVRFLEYSDEMV